MGSSPLTRGKRAANPRLRRTVGLIPTRAGKTRSPRSSRASSTAHPRSCGENRTDDCHKITKRGSSPLTRGKHSDTPARHRRARLIPAHVGKTLVPFGVTDGPWAHPHSRGENAAISASDATDKGSSPLTRGKRKPQRADLQQHGLIPAHAGKTTALFQPCDSGTAHPRSRRENTPSGSHPPRSYGSSPLTRGKLLGLG